MADKAALQAEREALQAQLKALTEAEEAASVETDESRLLADLEDHKLDPRALGKVLAKIFDALGDRLNPADEDDEATPAKAAAELDPATLKAPAKSTGKAEK